MLTVSDAMISGASSGFWSCSGGRLEYAKILLMVNLESCFGGVSLDFGWPEASFKGLGTFSHDVYRPEA